MAGDFGTPHRRDPAPWVPATTHSLATASTITGGGGELYNNCRGVWNALRSPIYPSDPGYGPHLDADGDGVGLETDPR